MAAGCRDAVVAVESGDYGNLDGSPATYRKGEFGRHIDCKHRLCYGGGVAVGRELRDMVGKRETERTVERLCIGKWGSPKGRRVYKPCPRMSA